MVTLVFSLLVRGGRETTAPELSSKATISAGFTNCRYLDHNGRRRIISQGVTMLSLLLHLYKKAVSTSKTTDILPCFFMSCYFLHLTAHKYNKSRAYLLRAAAAGSTCLAAPFFPPPLRPLSGLLASKYSTNF